jgi:hypothetical protein
MLLNFSSSLLGGLMPRRLIFPNTIPGISSLPTKSRDLSSYEDEKQLFEIPSA